MMWTGSWLPLRAWKDVMCCGALLSKMVKSCCCKPATAGPDFGVTTTSRSILDGGAEVAGVFCCAKNTAVHSTGVKRRNPTRVQMDMTSLHEGRSVSTENQIIGGVLPKHPRGWMRAGKPEFPPAMTKGVSTRVS